MKLAGRQVLVVGLGRSGVAAARFLASRGARVTATDKRGVIALGEAVAELGSGIALELDGHREASFLNADLVVVSPGVPNIPEIAAARRAGHEVIGEVELACRFLHGRTHLIAITGTNGKSTTTSLIGHLLAPLGQPMFVGGNLGTPLISAIDSPAAGENGIVVAEVSSFQLETVQFAHATMALYLNLTEDHLDRYPSMADYDSAKQNVFLNQTPADTAIVRAGLSARTAAQVRRFSSTQPADATLERDQLVVENVRYPTAEIPLVGRHNYENALAAFLVAQLSGVPSAAIRERVRSFHALPHRMEPVGELRGILFYDDSKATNVGSVVGSLEGFPRPYVLIAGGRDKGGDYAPLRDVLIGCARAVVLIGEARDKIAAALGQDVPLAQASTMTDAVRRAFSLSRPGDAIVLSPACSSFDMFRNYEDRGCAFRAAIAALSEEVVAC